MEAETLRIVCFTLRAWIFDARSTKKKMKPGMLVKRGQLKSNMQDEAGKLEKRMFSLNSKI